MPPQSIAQGTGHCPRSGDHTFDPLGRRPGEFGRLLPPTIARSLPGMGGSKPRSSLGWRGYLSLGRLHQRRPGRESISPMATSTASKVLWRPAPRRKFYPASQAVAATRVLAARWVVPLYVLALPGGLPGPAPLRRAPRAREPSRLQTRWNMDPRSRRVGYLIDLCGFTGVLLCVSLEDLRSLGLLCLQRIRMRRGFRFGPEPLVAGLL